MTLDQLSVNGGLYQAKPADDISWLMLVNHTLYVYVRAFLEANELVFLNRNDAQRCVPPEILNAVDFIDEVFKAKNWKKKIKDNKVMLDAVFKKTTQIVGVDDIKGYEAPIVY